MVSTEFEFIGRTILEHWVHYILCMDNQAKDLKFLGFSFPSLKQDDNSYLIGLLWGLSEIGCVAVLYDCSFTSTSFPPSFAVIFCLSEVRIISKLTS